MISQVEVVMNALLKQYLLRIAIRIPKYGWFELFRQGLALEQLRNLTRVRYSGAVGQDSVM